MTALIAGVAAASVFAVLGAGFCYHKSVLRSRSGDSVDYPVYGVTGPAKECSPSGDRKLAQSAQMYHYQHQKNQMISVNRGTGAHLEEESEGEQEYEEADYTVYECPGLASVSSTYKHQKYFIIAIILDWWNGSQESSLQWWSNT